MTQNDFNATLLSLAAGQLPPPAPPHAIARQLLRRDRRRTRLFATLAFFFWSLGAAGLLWLVFALNRLVLFLRLSPGLPWSRPDLDAQFKLDPHQLESWGTNLIHHSTPYIAAAIACLVLAAFFTILLISSSRQAILNRINLSLAEIAEQLKHPGPSSPAAQSQYIPAQQNKPSPFQSILLLFLLLNLVAIDIVIIGTIYYAKTRLHSPPADSAISLPWQSYPRLSPFHAMRYPTANTIEIQLADNTWYQLLSLNNIATPDLIAACQSLDPKDWQKRFEQDLIEVLTRTGHAPPTLASVSLKLTNLTTHQTTTQEIPMTKENRQALLESRKAINSSEHN